MDGGDVNHTGGGIKLVVFAEPTKTTERNYSRRGEKAVREKISYSRRDGDTTGQIAETRSRNTHRHD
jgi:hypothetical protein